MAIPMQLHPDAAHRLAMAMVDSSRAPLLLLDGDLTVLAASATFCQTFRMQPSDATGRPIFALGSGEWDVRQLRSLLDATVGGQADIEAYEMDLKAPSQLPRQLVVSARRLEFGDADNIRLLVTVTDITEARLAEKLKDDLLREKAVLLQEVQHRVANSLQIIASVLLQSARKVQSDETRSYLRDAHSRVMSIATVQQQLAASRVGDVELRTYFKQLCQSLGASMISDHDRLFIEVTADDSVVSPDVSVSLGLIVTELVINALKHAFPGGRRGRIQVSYQAQGPDWTLSVSDNGIGMPKGRISAVPGLGTSIVEALAKQMESRVTVADAAPGANISVSHSQIAATGDLPTRVAI